GGPAPLLESGGAWFAWSRCRGGEGRCSAGRRSAVRWKSRKMEPVMSGYILRRVLYMIPTLVGISIISFIVIQLPPGDFVNAMAARLAEQGENLDGARLAALRERYGLDQPVYMQYFKWMFGILTRGDFGMSFEWSQPVSDLLWERLVLTFVLAF